MQGYITDATPTAIERTSPTSHDSAETSAEDRPIKNDTTLVTLFLVGNSIEEEGARHLAGALKDNHTLAWPGCSVIKHVDTLVTGNTCAGMGGPHVHACGGQARARTGGERGVGASGQAMGPGPGARGQAWGAGAVRFLVRAAGS